VPNLTWSNIGREVLMDAGAPATIPAFSTIMACSTSMIGAIEAAGMINGVDRNLALVGLEAFGPPFSSALRLARHCSRGERSPVELHDNWPEES
jgi:acetyl-CoA acetyltransferase